MNDSPLPSVSPAFRRLLLVTAVMLYLLIVAGIAVRVSATGGACPDWPACRFAEQNSSWWPAAHRLAALGSGLLMAAVTAWAWLRYRHLRWLSWSLAAALFLGAGQAWLGTRLVGPSPSLSALHFGAALLVQTLVLMAGVAVSDRRLVTGDQ